MKINDNWKKFRQYLCQRGIFYAFLRSIKYLFFLYKKAKNPAKNHFLSLGPLRLFLDQRSIQIFRLDRCITVGSGLGVGINTLGLWTDSSKAKWQLLEKNIQYVKLQVCFDDIPLIQVWKISIGENGRIAWEIESINSEWLHLDELRIVGLLNPAYTSWFCGYEQGEFLRFRKDWHDFKIAGHAPLIGARFPAEGSGLPAFAIESRDKDAHVLIQNSSFHENLRLIGYSFSYPEEKSGLASGSRQLFNIGIRVFEDDSELDSKLEFLRGNELSCCLKAGGLTYFDNNIKVMLANLPWQKNGLCGVRAGSRWPHTKDPSEGNYMPFPFFLAHAAALLEKNKIDVRIIDAIAEGLSEDVFMDRISGAGINYLVAETSVPSFFQDMVILKKISLFGIKIILCGPNSLMYEDNFMQQYPFIDFILVGEYEFALLDLVKALSVKTALSRVPGIIYKDENKILRTPPRKLSSIDELPWPHRETLPMDKYWDLPGNIPQPSVQMLASRGCPFNCSFCLWPQVMYQGNSYRCREIADVVNEMEHLVKEKGFKSVYFDDDTFNVGKERMLQFCGAIRQRGLENTPWAIMARADLMDREILENMKSAGLWAVKYGVESCVQELVEKYGKNMNLSKTAEIIKITKELGIKVHLTFCFGASGETKESIQRTIDFALNQDPESVQFSILTPFPGTRLFEDLDKQGRILTKDWSKYDGHHNCVFEPEGLSISDLELAKRRAYHLWQESKRKKRGFLGDMARFKKYLKERGFVFVIAKTFDYLNFIFFKRDKYLNGRTG